MSEAIVAICPSCAQKYRVSRDHIGMRARCKKCGQPFRLLEEPPIDDETIFGWVTEDDPASQSVMGGSSIFQHGFHESTQVPAENRWVHPPPPEVPRVTFLSLADDGAHFRFPIDELLDRDLRCSIPHRCAQCLTREDLELHLVIWPERVPACDAAMINETETRVHRPLAKVMEEHGLNWFRSLETIPTMPEPFDQPFPYFICPQCSVIGSVRGRVVREGSDDVCQLIVANPTIALEFYRNNGGRGTAGYQKLLVASRRRRDNQWKSLAAGTRAKLGKWFSPDPDEEFLGYYFDRDFSRADRGNAGVVLTNKRLVYKKYAALREYPLAKGGKLEIDAGPNVAQVEINQEDQHPGLLSTTPLAASSLARSLTDLKRNWTITVVTQR